MSFLIQTKALANKIAQSILSNAGSIVPMAKTSGKTVNRAVDKYCLCDMEETSTTIAEKEQSMEHSPPPETKQEKIPSNYELCKEPRCNRCRGRISSMASAAKNRYRKDAIRYLTLHLTDLPNMGETAVVPRSTRAAAEVAIHRSSR